MHHQICADYTQEFLFPPRLEDWVGPKHPVRFIREFVDAIDLKEKGVLWAESPVGRPGYSADLLLKVWLYGYFERVRSTRRLEKACRDHLGFIWLAGMHVPDHNTLSRFFRANKKSIRSLFKETISVAIEADLVGFALHAVDGTKMAAQVAARSGLHKDRLRKRLAALDEELSALEAEIEASAGDDTPSDSLSDTLTDRRALREKIEGALAQLEESKRNFMHPADPDARIMKSKEHNRNIAAYNAQAVVDEKAGLLVACEVVQDCNDEQQLNAMIEKVEEQAGQSAARTVADAGYATGREFEQAEKHHRDVAVALPQKMRPDADKPYAASNFRFDEERNRVICPHDTTLDYVGTYRKNDYQIRRYHCKNTQCPFRSQCTKNARGRFVTITQYHETVTRQRKRQEEATRKEDLKKRGYLIESVFAFIKQHLGFRRFTHDGLEKTNAQWSLVCTTYNLHKLYKHWVSGRLTLPPKAPAIA